MKEVSMATISRTLRVGLLTATIALPLLVASHAAARQKGGVSISLAGGYGAAALSSVDPASNHAAFTHGGLANLVLAIWIRGGPPQFAPMYSFQGLGDESGLIHHHTVGLAVRPGKGGFRVRGGLGVSVLTPFDGETDGGVGFAGDMGLGYEAPLGRGAAFLIEVPIGMAILTVDDVDINETLFGLQLGFTFGRVNQ